MSSSTKNILVTGGTGFIGRYVVDALIGRGHRVRLLLRSVSRIDPPPASPGTRMTVATGDLTEPTSLAGVCRDIDTVFHLAGYAHAQDAHSKRADELHQCITVEGTRALLHEAAQAGVKRFIFVSSVKAMGEGGESCLDEHSPAVPVSGYGRAKRQAESLVLDAGVRHDMHVAVLRLPLVYGRGNRGNLPRMIAAIDRGRFPPLPQKHNRRSMVHVEDVVQALIVAGERSQACGQIYIVTDGQTFSTSQLYQDIRRALGLEPPRWTMPVAILKGAACIGDAIGWALRRPFVFDSTVFESLFGSAHYSNAKIERELGFSPRHTLAQALPEMVAEYRQARSTPLP